MVDVILETENTKKPAGKYLFSPLIDFLGLGGLSLLAFILLFPLPEIKLNNVFAFVGLTLILSSFVNYPHFAHSYQIFYRDFRRKIGGGTPSYLRYRYWFAGIIVPILMTLFFSVSLITQRLDFIGYGVNAMSFLVGWHYVKQGYGMLIVDSVLKKKFLTEIEKKLLVWNAYAVWLYIWTRTNSVIKEGDYFGLSTYSFDVPDPIHYFTIACLIVFGVSVLTIFVRRLSPGGKGLALNGTMAYLVSSYYWLGIISSNPVLVAFIPAFHSLQYLTVVNRFQLNVETEKAQNSDQKAGVKTSSRGPKERLLKFYLVGIFIGVLGFLLIPFSLVSILDYEGRGLPALLPLIAIWLFINIHHYFLDNVMWRKGNPDVGKHLFAQR